jgi:pimeloyl-ACP methyl ester carboxylesterase
MEIVGPSSCYYVSQRLRLHYVDWGNPTAPPLILVHGGRDHARSWDWVARALRNRFRVIAPDLRGHGDSGWAVGSNYHHHEFVYDLAQLVDVIAGPEAPVAMIGHSFGGAIISQYAASFPERMERFINIEGFGPPPELIESWSATPMHEQTRNWVEQLRGLAARQPRRYSSIEDAAKRMQKENPSLSEGQANHLTVHGVARNEDGTYSWKFDNYFRSFPPRVWQPDALVETWSQIDCPTLLVRGADSWAGDPQADGRIEALPEGSQATIPNAAHWVMHDNFEAFMKAADDFLS